MQGLNLLITIYEKLSAFPSDSWASCSFIILLCSTHIKRQ